MASGCETSRGEAVLPMAEVSARSQFSSWTKSGLLDSDNRFTKLIRARGGVSGYSYLMNGD